MSRSLRLLILAAGLAATAACNGPTDPTPGGCELTSAPQSFSLCMKSAGELSVAVSTSHGCRWIAEPESPWLSVTANASGIGDGAFRFTVTDNWDAPRTGSVKVRSVPSGRASDVQIAQAGCRYWVSQQAFQFGPAGGSATVDVLQQSDPLTCGGPLQNACMWTAVANAPWITVLTGMPRIGDSPMSFSVAPNNTGLSRTATISVRDQTIHIMQVAN